MPDYTITSYTFRVAVILQDCVRFDRKKNTWVEKYHTIPYREDFAKWPPNESVDREVYSKVCAAVLAKLQVGDGPPMIGELQAISAVVIGYGANLEARKEGEVKG